MLQKIKNIIQDCNINFLLGSGLSSPYLPTLGNIETLLTQLEQGSQDKEVAKLIRMSIYKKYFDEVLVKNLKVLQDDSACHSVRDAYHEFLNILNSVLLRRKSTILSKEVNIFTTNADIFLEKALEDLGLEYNDGFNGRFKPVFSLSNFKKSRFKKSLHYDNVAEIPVFNLLKLHGSLSWEIENTDRIVFSCDLKDVKNAESKIITADQVLTVSGSSTLAELTAEAAGKTADATAEQFMEAYEKLLIVNPTKEKFKHTLLNQTYYEMLRLYSNELEKENTVLFVMGFSFADEHIKEITLRAANSNPTLMIYVIAHTSQTKKNIEARFGVNTIKNRNIEVIAPPQEPATDGTLNADKFKYDLPTINKEIFGRLFENDGETELWPEQPSEESKG